MRVARLRRRRSGGHAREPRHLGDDRLTHLRGADAPRALGRHGAFTIERVPSGTNLFRLRVSGTDPASLQRRLASAHVMVAPPQNGAFLIGVNETLNRTSAADLTETFVRALAG